MEEGADCTEQMIISILRQEKTTSKQDDVLKNRPKKLILEIKYVMAEKKKKKWALSFGRQAEEISQKAVQKS